MQASMLLSVISYFYLAYFIQNTKVKTYTCDYTIANECIIRKLHYINMWFSYNIVAVFKMYTGYTIMLVKCVNYCSSI